MINIDELSRAIGRIEGKLDNLCDTIKNYGGRIDIIEVEQANTKGMLKITGAIGVFIGSIVTVIVSWLLKK